MNINASIIDQRVTGIVEEHSEWLPAGTDINKKKSAAFVLLCISTCLELSLAEAAELLTEGGNDAGVDGLHIGEVGDGEFLVTVFQGKYKVRDLSGEANFPENGVQKAVDRAAYHRDAVEAVTHALMACYGDRDISLQQLSATFRRGDLLEMLDL